MNVSCESGSECDRDLALQVLDRGERIELLVDKTNNLQMEATDFSRSSRTLKRKTRWQSYKWYIVSVVLLLLIVYFIVAVACSPTFHCPAKKS